MNSYEEVEKLVQHILDRRENTDCLGILIPKNHRTDSFSTYFFFLLDKNKVPYSFHAKQDENWKEIEFTTKSIENYRGKLEKIKFSIGLFEKFYFWFSVERNEDIRKLDSDLSHKVSIVAFINTIFSLYIAGFDDLTNILVSLVMYGWVFINLYWHRNINLIITQVKYLKKVNQIKYKLVSRPSVAWIYAFMRSYVTNWVTILFILLSQRLLVPLSGMNRGSNPLSLEPSFFVHMFENAFFSMISRGEVDHWIAKNSTNTASEKGTKKFDERQSIFIRSAWDVCWGLIKTLDLVYPVPITRALLLGLCLINCLLLTPYLWQKLKSLKLICVSSKNSSNIKLYFYK